MQNFWIKTKNSKGWTRWRCARPWSLQNWRWFQIEDIYTGAGSKDDKMRRWLSRKSWRKRLV